MERNRDPQSPNGQAEGVGEAAKRLASDVDRLGRSVARERDELADSISSFVRSRPLESVAIAFGVGYVLGGGLFTRTTGRLFGLGLRLGGLATVKDLLGGVGRI